MKKIIRYLIICLVFILYSTGVYSQYISNPSFEGPVGFSKIPPGWTICDKLSTPDTGPDPDAAADFPASDGNSYIDLVTRGSNCPNPNTTEDCKTQLLQPLLKGGCYVLKIDLAFYRSIGEEVISWGWVDYGNPVKLKIYGSLNGCDNLELLGQTDSIYNEKWETYSFEFRPLNTDIYYLTFKVDYAKNYPYFGNLELDNIRIVNYYGMDVTKLDATIEYGENLMLIPSSADDYNWELQKGMDCLKCTTQMVYPDYSTTYKVSLKYNNIQCGNHNEYFKINVNKFIPNLISPNSDGINENFRIKGLEPNSKLTITNRWGKILYNTVNYDNSWDGTYKGKKLPPDTYWYVFDSPSGEGPITGYIYVKY